MILKNLPLFLLAIVVSGCGRSYSQSPDELAEGSKVSIAGHSFPACYDANHRKVSVKNTQSAEGGPAFSTLTASGTPVIVFNDQFMQQIAHSAAMVMFVYEHECGHHALGHIKVAQTSHGDLNQKGHFKQELDADCYSAQQLKAMGYTSSSIADIIDDVYPWPKDSEHPSGKVRSHHVTACFKAAGE